MESRCTCGVVLVDDARFCHKCGKPQFEEDINRLRDLEESSGPVQAPLQPPALESKLALGGISFRNSRAVLISLVVAIGSMATGVIICLLPIALVAIRLYPIFLCAVGFVSVYLYRRGAKEPLSTSAGARLGWMTGLWIFLVTAILLVITALVIASPAGWEQVKATRAQLPQSAELLSLSQHDLLVQMLIFLPLSFLMTTLLPGLGGILGAKLSARRR